MATPREYISKKKSSSSDSTRAGALIGAGIGSFAGFAIWTPVPDAIHMMIALAVIVLAIVIGGMLGSLLGIVDSTLAQIEDFDDKSKASRH